MAVIEVCQRLVVQAGVAMRAVPRLFAILYRKLEATTVIPAASSVRWWLQRLGLYALREPLPRAGDGVLLIDHSVQIGTVKVCVILGIRLSDVPYPRRALRFEDMHVIAVIPVEQSTGEIVLKRRFEDDPQWSEYIGRLGQVKSSIRQTIDAFLASPSLRPKARYMNLESLLKWSRRMLGLLDRDASGGRASERAELRYGWLRDDRTSIEKWSRWEATVRASVSSVRTRGLSVDSESELREHLSEVPPALYDETLATELLSLGALLGAWPPSRIQAALEATPVKHVVRWCQDNLPSSVQSQRRIALSAQKM